MKTRLPALFLLVTVLLSGCTSTSPVLRSGDTTVRLAPEHAARVMSFCPNGHANLLWDNPLEDKALWKWMNYGGEKTWIGPQTFWKEIPEGSWPPPAFFDQAEFTIVDRTPTSCTMRSPFDDYWHLAVERTVSLTNDVLYISARVLTAPAAPPIRPLSDLYVWSVTQVPSFPHVSAHLIGEGRYQNDVDDSGPLPEPTRQGDELRFDISTFSDCGKCVMDADALTVELPDGHLIVQLHTTSTDLGPKPNRCHFYSGDHPSTPPRQDTRYLELEFLVPATETHTVSLQFVPAP